MGFERICAILQGVSSNYDTDVFRPLIARIESLADLRYGEDVEADMAMRVIADHIRAVSFAIADGASPSNEGRGYVVRRILRRAIPMAGTSWTSRSPFSTSWSLFWLISTRSCSRFWRIRRSLWRVWCLQKSEAFCVHWVRGSLCSAI